MLLILWPKRSLTHPKRLKVSFFDPLLLLHELLNWPWGAGAAAALAAFNFYELWLSTTTVEAKDLNLTSLLQLYSPCKKVPTGSTIRNSVLLAFSQNSTSFFGVLVPLWMQRVSKKKTKFCCCLMAAAGQRSWRWHTKRSPTDCRCWPC